MIRKNRLLLERSKYDNYDILDVKDNGSHNSTDIVDLCGHKAIELHGDAKISTTQSQSGGSSLVFNNSTSYIQLANHNDFDFSSGDFTVSCYVFIEAMKNYNCIFSKVNAYSDNHMFSALIKSDGNMLILSSANWIEVPAGLSTSTWHKIEIQRTGDNLQVYVDDIQVKNQGLATNYSFPVSTAPFRIGSSFSTPSPLYTLSGYIENFRYSKGIARI